MDFLKLAHERYSVRKSRTKRSSAKNSTRYSKRDAAAPTAVNNQPQRVLVIESAEALEKLKKCTPCHFSAPLALLVCYDNAASWKRNSTDTTWGRWTRPSSRRT